MVTINGRDDGISLLSFNGTNVWFAPGAAINSSDAFEHASNLEDQAYIANRWLFVAVMIVLALFIVLRLPHIFIRMRNAPTWRYNFHLLGQQPGSPTSSQKGAPYRLRQLQLHLPPIRVPGFDLPLDEFLVVLTLWMAGLGVAAWCQATFLTHASRSTLVIMFFMSLTAGLGVKSGGIGTWVVYGYTAVNFLHRWTGRLVLLLSTLHVVAYLVVFYRAGIAQQEMAKPENYLGALGYGGLCLTGLMSVRPVRRSYWLLFKSGHHLGIMLLLAGLNYHSPDVVPYLLAIWILALLNTFFRSVTTRITTAHLLPLPGAASTLVTIPSLSAGFTPGQHVRIRMFGLGWKNMLESHPFTIASSDGSRGGLRLVVKNAGDWTSDLYNDAAAAGEKGKIVRCTVEGPYGGPINFIFNAFSSVLVVVGGSGISFGLGVAAGLIADTLQGNTACTSLTLVWIVRDSNTLDALASQLMNLVVSVDGMDRVQPDFRLTLILCHTLLETGSSESEKRSSLASWRQFEAPMVNVKFVNSRPDTKAILDEVVTNTKANGGVGIGSCGPAPMVDALGKLVWELSKSERIRVGGVEYHAERFSL